MKRVTITFASVVVALILIGGVVFLIDRVTSPPSGKVVREELSYKRGEITGVDIDIDIGFVTVYKNVDEAFELGLSEPDKGLYSPVLEGGVLRITENETSWLDRVGRGESDKYGVEIGIPEGVTVSLSVDAEVSTVSVDGVSLTKDTEITVGTGGLSLNGIETDGAVTLAVDTGNVELGFIDCTELSAEVTTGDVSVRSISAESAISLTVTTGKVFGELPGPKEDYTVTSSVTTGVSDLVSSGSGKKKLTVSVGTGSIALSFSK